MDKFGIEKGMIGAIVRETRARPVSLRALNGAPGPFFGRPRGRPDRGMGPGGAGGGGGPAECGRRASAVGRRPGRRSPPVCNRRSRSTDASSKRSTRSASSRHPDLCLRGGVAPVRGLPFAPQSYVGMIDEVCWDFPGSKCHRHGCEPWGTRPRGEAAAQWPNLYYLHRRRCRTRY